MSQTITEAGVRQVVTTDELKALLAQGYTIDLPDVTVDSAVRGAFSTEDLARLDASPAGNDVVSVEYVGEEEVQCIMVDDPEHLYLTDDFIPTHNTNNIVYLKSNDDQMLEVLEKMSGTTHRSWRNSKQITQDVDRIIGGQVEGKVTYTMSTEKEPLISLNDLMFIPPRNSVVFRAGDAPIWNRNESILPMSWRLLQNSINHPGNEYSLQTIPTLSTAREFDVRMNQPDFYKMLDKRMAQALNAENATELYKQVYDYSEVDIERLDPDVYATEVMEIVQMMTNVDAGRDPHAAQEADLDDFEMMLVDLDDESVSDNVAVAAEKDRRLAEQAEREKKIYAEHTISRDMLTKPDGTARLKSLDQQISEAYRAAMIEMQADDVHFSVGADDELRSADGSQAYITPERSESFVQAAQKLNAAAGDPDSRVFGDHEVTADDMRALSTMRVHAAFYRFLASLPSWQPLAGGAFDRAMAVEMRGEREKW